MSSKMIDSLSVPNHIDVLKEMLHKLSAYHLDSILAKVEYIEEDWWQTYNSFSDPGCVQLKAIEKKTVKYASQYYGMRLIEIINALLPLVYEASMFKEVRELSQIKTFYSNQAAFSVAIQPNTSFRNPLPQVLFFSQQYHSPVFSNKSQREGVSGLSVREVSEKLRNHDMSPDFVRVEMYFAPFRGKLEPFAYNNRTLAAFSMAKVDATRIVPIMPDQDLLNRVIRREQNELNCKLDQIIDESQTGHIVPTVSIRSGGL